MNKQQKLQELAVAIHVCLHNNYGYCYLFS